MALGLTKSEIQEVLDREIMDELIVKYNTKSEEPPQLSHILAMRDLIIELIVLNNEQIEAQLSNMRVSFS